jgi:reductive dehalogenase
MFYKVGEKKAVIKSFLIFDTIIIIAFLIYFFKLQTFLFLIYLGFILLGLLGIYPRPSYSGIVDLVPIKRADERDIMFSRKELEKGTDRYREYYARNPEKEILDNLFRKEPGLLSSKALFYHPKAFNSARTFFKKIDDLKPLINGDISAKKSSLTPGEHRSMLFNKAMQLGALDIGICRCQSYHFYTHKGRGTDYGIPITNTHKYAIAFTVEMDHKMVQAAPNASIVMESARQYLNAARIATKIAVMIRNLGYGARAHIDGNYQVICPLVGRDAGLGEIGRMGLLMTPTHGPRVRIGVITTDMELEVSTYEQDHSVIDFCRMCKKCADCCPAQSIPHDDPKLIEGCMRWKINSESCFTFWCKSGTDCGRCMSVCPYSHPDHSLHKLVRWGISRSKAFRWIALQMDDFFYGKKPKPKDLPKFLDQNKPIK